MKKEGVGVFVRYSIMFLLILSILFSVGFAQSNDTTNADFLSISLPNYTYTQQGVQIGQPVGWELEIFNETIMYQTPAVHVYTEFRETSQAWYLDVHVFSESSVTYENVSLGFYTPKTPYITVDDNLNFSVNDIEDFENSNVTVLLDSFDGSYNFTISGTSKFGPRPQGIIRKQFTARVGQEVEWEVTATNVSEVELPKSAQNVNSLVNGKRDTLQKKGVDSFTDSIIGGEANDTFLVPENVDATITFTTPAPSKRETKFKDGKKRVTVESSVHYENVTAYTDIPETKRGDVVVEWIKNGERIQLPVSKYIDSDADGLIDGIEWIAPHLSTQEFEIILITSAYHLDANRNELANIYESVYELDGNWSPKIYHEQYVRVTFEENLTNEKDITVYTRNVDGTDTRILAYKANTTELVGSFPLLTQEGRYQILLTNMTGVEDEFDLRIENVDNDNLAFLEFDLIIDPTASPLDAILLKAQTCNSNNEGTINTFPNACDGTIPAACGTGAGNDLLSCNDGGVETHGAKLDTYGGVNISVYNSSIGDCESITSVTVCYEWWSDKGNLGDCQINIDDDGDGTYTSVNSTCPGTTANPGLFCEDISTVDGTLNSAAGWECRDFFNGVETPARIMSQVDKSANAGGTAIISWDALFFNVTYTADTTAPAITLDAQADNSWFNALTQDYQYTPTDGLLDSCLLYTDFGGTWGVEDTNRSVISGSQDTVSLTAPADGSYEWNVWCNDTAGNAGYAPANFTINLDTTAPAIVQTAPVDRLNQSSSTLLFNFTPTDNLASTVDCNLTVDGSNVVTNQQITSGNWFNHTETGLSEGIHTWTVTCEDTVTNSFTTTSREFRIDQTDPIPVPIFPTSNFNTTATSINFNWSITDNLHDLPSCDLYVDGSVNVSGIDSPNGTWTNQTVNNFADGVHTWYMSCTDDAGNTGSFGAETFRVDTTGPDVTLQFPETNTWRNYSSVTLEYNTTDALLGVDYCELVVNASVEDTDVTITEAITQSFAHPFVELTAQTWNVQCYDDLGNSNSGTQRTINLDFTNPTFSDNEVNGTEFGINDYACLNVTVADTNSITSVVANVNFPTSGLTNVTLTNSGCGNAGGNVYSAEVLVDEAGQYNWSRMYITDVADNVNDSQFSFITFNASSNYFLNLTMNPPTAAFEINESNELVNYSFLQTCTVECTDTSSGNCEDVNIYSEYQVGTYQYVNTTSTILFANQSLASCGSLAPDAVCSTTFNVTTTTISGPDFDRLRCTALSSNAATNFSTYENVTINDHPVAAFIPANTTQLTGTVTLNATVSSDDQGISNYHFEYDNVTAFSSPTTICNGASATCAFDTTSQVQCVENTNDCFIRLTITDTDGLVNSTYHLHPIDNVDPVVDLDSPANDTWVTTSSQTFAYTATDLALDTCSLYTSSGPGGWNVNATNASVISGQQDSQTISLADGTYVWNVQCADLAGNTAYNATNYTIKIDTIDPTVVLNQPSDASALGIDTIVFNYTPTDVNLDYCELYGNWTGSWALNHTANSPTSGVLNSFPAKTLPDGNHKWNVVCYDEAGRSDTAANNFTFSVDTAAPTAFNLLTQANNTQSTDLTPSLTWEQTTDLNFDNYTILFDTDPTFATPDREFDTATISSTSLTVPGGSALVDNTAYFWRVIAYDQFGLSTQSTDDFAYVTDSVAPTIALISPQNYTNYTANSAIEFEFSITEVNQIDNCTVILNGEKDVDNAIYDVANGTTVSILKTPITNGLYDWNISCFDYAGNEGFSETRFLNISVNYPQLTWYPTSTSNTATPNLLLQQDGTLNSNTATCTADNLITLSTATDGLENKGVVLLGDQVMSFASQIDAFRDSYITFEVLYDNGSGFSRYGQDGDDNTGGTLALQGTTNISAANNLTDSFDVYLNASHQLRLISRLYRPAGGGSGSCSQFWDNYTSMQLYAYNLSDLTVNITDPTINSSYNESHTFNATCEIDCPGGWCLNSKVALQVNTTSGWVNVNSTGGNIRLTGGVQVNPYTIGNINTITTQEFNLTAFTPSNNALRCIGLSDYSDVNGTTERGISINDTTNPVIVAHDVLPDPVAYGNNFTVYANVTDNVNVKDVLVEIDGINYTMVVTGRDDEYSFEFNTTTFGNGTFTYRIDANDSSDNIATEQSGTVTIRSAELTIDSIIFDPVEGVETESSAVSVTVRNYGGRNVTGVNLTLQVYRWTGSWVSEANLSASVNVLTSVVNVSNFTWTNQIDHLRFNATIDYDSKIYETDETDNVFSRNYSISSYELFYGEVPYNLELFNSGTDTFNEWSVTNVAGLLFFSDIDSAFMPFNLRPLNGSDDFAQADTALGMTNLNDSVSKTWDVDQDSSADTNGTFTIGGAIYSDVPIINSTNSSTFVTGILWDLGDGGSTYDGSQDLVFVTRINDSKVGLYGTYDYEAKVPALLRSLDAGSDSILFSFAYD